MYCPNCGKDVTNEYNLTCGCGFNMELLRAFMANPYAVKQSQSSYAVTPYGTVAGPKVSAGRTPATAIPNEEPAFQVPAKPVNHIRNTRAMYYRLGQVMPDIIADYLFKVKCEFCSTVISYYQSDTIVHRNYPSGYVDCPCCRNHLAHNKELAIAEFMINVNDYPGA